MSGQPAPDDEPLPVIPREREEAAAAQFSRPTETSSFGKCSTRIEVPVPEELRDALSLLASMEQQALATYVRGVMEAHVLKEGVRVERILALFRGGANPRNGG